MLLLATTASLFLLGLVPLEQAPKKMTLSSNTKVSEVYGKQPLTFEENRSQVDERVKYLARGPGYHLFLTPTEAVFSFFSSVPPLPPRIKPEVPEIKTKN
jgi:hypothetical protein